MEDATIDPRQDLKSYSDIRKFVAPTAFSRAMSYMSWHNRLTFTHMMLPWEALVVSLAYELHEIDPFMYSAIKAFLDETRDIEPTSLEQCRQRAANLIERLYPSA